MDYTIRTAEVHDANAFYGISRRSHTEAYYDQLIPEESQADFYTYYQWSGESERSYVAIMARKIVHPAWHVAAAECNGSVIGYTIAHSKIPGKLMLRGLFVDPDFHAKGVGTALFERSLAWAKPGDTVELAVIEKNTVARRLYERHGFVVSGDSEKDFFGASMVRMSRVED